VLSSFFNQTFKTVSLAAHSQQIIGALAMRDVNDPGYYLARAEQEEASARRTSNALAATIHLGLAERYRACAREFEEVIRLRLVRD
jgi:hypothetical protein